MVISRSLVRGLPILLFAALVGASHLTAQRPGGPVPNAAGNQLTVTSAIYVEPTRAPNTGPYSVPFTVKNTGTTTLGSIFLTCELGGPVTCGTVTPSFRSSLVGGASFSVTVTYSVGAPGTGFVGMRATYGGEINPLSSYKERTVVVGNPGPPSVTLRNHNADNLDRSLCLTAGAGQAAASVCGDLVVAHALPGYSTMGRERTLTLLYNSRTAYYRPIITAAVTQPAGLLRPSAVYVQLDIAGVNRKAGTYNAWNDSTRQIAISYDAPGLGQGTGVYPFTLQVQNQYAGGGIYTASVSGNLIVVNRYNSPFGAGVGIAGVEGLFFNQPQGQPDGSILWVGGDGSAKLYAPAGPDRWAAPAGAYRDTLVRNPADTTYTRTLRHGIQVVFNATGKHIRTVSRTSQTTTFQWNLDTLKSITVPPGGTSGVTYTFAYHNSTGFLDRITDPVGRVLDVTITGGLLSTIVDPDGYSVAFGYDGDRKMITRRNRRGNTTTYEYGKAHRLTKVTIPVGRQPGDNAVAVTQFEPWDERGLVTGTTGQLAVDTGQAYTRVLGPRYSPTFPDTAAFWIDRWGAPVKVVDAVPATTTIVRGNAALPALVTRVRLPDGRVDSMTYDDRANLVKLIDSTTQTTYPLPTAATQYAYTDPNTKDSPSSVTDPEGVITRYAYNSLGLTSQVTAPNGHVTKYSYTAGTLAGLVKAVTELQVPAWDSTLRREVTDSQHTGFAFNSLGNVVNDTSPMKRTHRFDRDAQQRVTNVYDAASHRTEYVYDAINRVTQTRQHVEQAGTPASLYPADPDFTSALTTSFLYDVDVLTVVTDPRTVSRRYSYDLADRQITETDDYSKTISRWFSPAGLLDSVRSRMGRVVRHVYDPAGRKIKTAWPAVPSGTGADSVVFTYDVMGRMTRAATAWPGAAAVDRTYYGTGALRTDVESAVAPGPLLQVTQAYAYDRAGRRTAHRIGAPGDAVHSDSVTYRYDAISGELRTIRVRWRTVRFGVIPDDSVRFRWDALGRRDSVEYTNGLKIALGYDKDGTQRLFCTARRVSAPATNDISQFRVVQDSVDTDGMTRRRNALGLAVPQGCVTTNTLSGLDAGMTYDNRHQLRSRSEAGHSYTYRYDGSANMLVSTKDGDSFTDTMDPTHNRLVRRYQQPANNYWLYQYYDDGGRLDENACPTIACVNENLGYRRYLYDGLGRTVGFNQYGCVTSGGGTICGVEHTADAYFDPLGRLLSPYEGGAPNLGYDGDNAVRTGSDGTNGDDWTFVQGPGLDDPVLGHYPGTTNLVAFYVTDGAGQQHAVMDRGGSDVTGRLEYTQRGGKYAGGTRNATSFEAERHPSADVPGISFFRNRIYDQRSGRWTQEDPIGVAGGLNLYAFNGNNPVAYSDPFGLCPTCGPALIAGLAVGGIRLGANLLSGRPAFENVGRDGILAGAAVLTLGAAVPLMAAATTGTAGAAPALGTGTERLVGMLEEAGPSMDARIQAVSAYLPTGQKAVMTALEGGARMLSGGAGSRATQVILNADGSTVVKKFNTAKEIFEVVKEIKP